MPLLTKLGSRSLLQQLRNYSSSSNTILTGQEKSRAVLSFFKSGIDSERILNICRAAVLTPHYNHDHILFPVAVSKLADSNYFGVTHDFIVKYKFHPDLRNEEFIVQSIVLYGQAGMTMYGITMFEQMEQMGIRRTVKSFNALLFSCYLAKKYDEVKRIFKEFPLRYKVVPDIDSYNTVIKALCVAGESSSGYSIVAAMAEKRYPKPNATTYANLLAWFCKDQKSEDVEKVQRLMKEHGMRAGDKFFVVRIESLCELGRSFKAKALLDDMLKKNMEPGADAYSSLVLGFCSEGKLEDAKKLFSSMVAHGYKPTKHCYYTLISLVCQSGDYETALQLSKQSIENKRAPNFMTMKSLLEGPVSISKVDEAKELVQLSRAKYRKKAHLWKETERKLISLVYQSGDYETALQLSKQSIENKWRPNFMTMKSLVEGLVSISKMDEAMELVQLLKAKYWEKAHLWKETERMLISLGCQSGDYETELQLSKQSIENKRAPNFRTMKSFVEGLVSFSKVDEAMELVQLLRVKFPEKARLWNEAEGEIISLVCQSGDQETSLQLSKQSIENERATNFMTMNSLVEGLVSISKVDEAMELVQLLRAKFPKKAHRWNEAERELISLVCQSGDYETALQLSKQSIANELAPNFRTMKSLVEGLVSISKVDEAKELVQLLRAKFQKKAHLWEETERKLSK